MQNKAYGDITLKKELCGSPITWHKVIHIAFCYHRESSLKSGLLETYPSLKLIQVNENIQGNMENI